MKPQLNKKYYCPSQVYRKNKKSRELLQKEADAMDTSPYTPFENCKVIELEGDLVVRFELNERGVEFFSDETKGFKEGFKELKV